MIENLLREASSRYLLALAQYHSSPLFWSPREQVVRIHCIQRTFIAPYSVRPRTYLKHVAHFAVISYPGYLGVCIYYVHQAVDIRKSGHFSSSRIETQNLIASWSILEWAPWIAGFKCESQSIGFASSLLVVEKWMSPGGGCDLFDKHRHPGQRHF